MKINKILKIFLIVFILIIVTGLSVWCYRYWQSSQIQIVGDMFPLKFPLSESSSWETELNKIDTELKENETAETDFSADNLQSLENDLDPTQFDVL